MNYPDHWGKRIDLPRPAKAATKKSKGRAPDPSLMTVAAVAQSLDLEERQVKAWTDLDMPPIECVRFGRMVRYRRTDVARYLKTLREDETGGL